jgi:hypothetical protein
MKKIFSDPDPEPDLDPLVSGMDLRIRIRHKMSRIPNTCCGLTFVAESCFVLVEPFEPDPLANDVEKLVEGGPPLLIVVHLLLRLLSSSAVHHSHLLTHIRHQKQCSG